VIFAFTGRRSPALDAAAATLVSERLRTLLTLRAPSAVVGAAACGADLLLLEEALRLRAPEVHIALPTPRERFREESVEPDWRPRFDAVLAEADDVTDAAGHAEDPYLAGNVAILRAATTLAAERGEEAVAVIVASPGQGEYSEHFAHEAALRHVRELRVLPD
jgi:hypothetical protein